MTGAEAAENKQKKFRSPPYPMFDLGKAVERTKMMHATAHHHQVGASTLAEAWGMKSGDGKVWRAAAALIQYGLVTDSGTGKTRKFQITDIAKRIVLDDNPDSERRKMALQTAALYPMIHKELWDEFKSTKGLADSVITTYLTIDREEKGEAPYSPSAASEVLNTYRATLAYAGLDDSVTLDEPPEVTETLSEGGGGPLKKSNIAIGDWVKWNSGGVDQFNARKVCWLSEDGSHLRVIGSMTGIPMAEVEKVPAPSHGASNPASTTPDPKAEADDAHGATPPAVKPGSGKLKSVSTSIVDGRLQLSADVSADEIDALRDMLSKYKEILTMMH